MKKRIEVAALDPVVGTLYPSPFDMPCRARERTKLGDAAGLTQYGVNLLRLPPGAWSSQRHWHTAGDEFVYVLSGEVTLVTDARRRGAARRRCGRLPGERSERPLPAKSLRRRRRVLEIGTRIAGDTAYYSDIDMMAPAGGKPAVYTHRDGTPYPNIRRRGP